MTGGLSPVSEAAWLDVARRSPEATFFHTPIWSRLVRRANPEWRDATVGCTFEGGGSAVMPLVEVGHVAKGALKSLVSTAYGCYGGPIADRPLDGAEAAGLCIAAGRSAGQLELLESPLAALPEPLDGFASREDFTDLVHLDPDPASVHASFSKSRRYKIRRGRASGVTVAVGETEADYRAYFELYEDSLRRWGDRASSRYPWTLFEAGLESATEFPESIRLWLGRLDGTAVAGAWVFSWNRHAAYWHGAAAAAGLEVHAPSVVFDEAIADACTRGLKWFDFNPSGGHEGVASLKRQFGTERRRVRRLRYERGLLRSVRRVKQLRKELL